MIPEILFVHADYAILEKEQKQDFGLSKESLEKTNGFGISDGESGSLLL